MTESDKDLSQAFAHPELRSEIADPADRMSLRDYIIEADIGAFQQERGFKQRLRFNLVVELSPQTGAETDDVDLILSYDTLTEAIAAELAAERLNLLETLAERIAARILTEPQAQRIFLRIEKLDRGPGALGIEIVRKKLATLPTVSRSQSHPVIALIAPETPGLSTLIGGLIAKGEALVIVLTPPQFPRPKAPIESAQVRIDLLAIEQAAWAVAAGNPQLTVVATKTEIDWAIRQSHPIIWAPSKLLIESRNAPTRVGDGLAPALWLAQEFGAARLVLYAPVTLPEQTADFHVPIEWG